MIAHLIQRGHYKQTIFKDNEDNLRFLELMNKYGNKYNITILAYCLMNNHYHILAMGENIVAFMRSLNMSYSKYFNKKYNLIGTLYQGRYTKREISNLNMLLIVYIYIMRNPFKAYGIHPSEYPWCSYADIGEKRNSWDINNIKTGNKSLQGYSDPKVIEKALNKQTSLKNFVDSQMNNILLS